MFKNKEYVLTVYNEGGFTKAAEKLYISQPSLSATIKRIEDKIQAPIFDRSCSPIALTEIGKKYVQHALEEQQIEQDFCRYVADYTQLLTGTVKIGGSSLFSSFLLPKMISEFKRSFPKINFEIFENNSINLIDKLNAGELDVVIDNAVIDSENIVNKIYTSEMILLAVPKNFSINDKISSFRLSSGDVKRNKHKSDKICIDLNCFKDQPFILLNPQNDTGARAIKLFKKHNISPQISFTLDQQVTAFNASCSGLGVSFVSDTLIKQLDFNSDLYFYRLNDKEIKRNIFFYQKKNKYSSLACNKFIEFNT